MHQDDCMHPNNLERKVAFLDEHPAVAFVHSDIRRIDAHDSDIGGHWLKQPEQDSVIPGKDCFRRLLLEGNFICCPAVMVRRDCMDQVGWFNPKLPFTVDLDMWLRLSSKFDVGYLASPLIDYRIHAGQETNQFARDGRAVQEYYNAIEFAMQTRPVFGSGKLFRSAYLRVINWAVKLARVEFKQKNWHSGLAYMRVIGLLMLKYPISAAKVLKLYSQELHS